MDCQNDFCDPKGALFVKGADKDCERIAAMIRQHGDKIDDIRITLDSHVPLHVAHGVCWQDSKGNNPPPFTFITKDDVVSGKYRATNPTWQKRYSDYVRSLSAGGMVIWPQHCLISTWGHGLYPCVIDAVNEWQNKYFAVADFVTKGSNIFSEHFGAVAAEVPDPADPTTNINTTFVKRLEDADVLLICGEALSHCVATTVRQIIAEFGVQHAKKFVILEDAVSPVPGFENLADDFVKEVKAQGVQFAKTTTFFK